MKRIFFSFCLVLLLVIFCGTAIADPVYVSRAVTAQNQYTDSISPYNSFLGGPKSGTLGLFVSGTFSATVSIQYSLDRGATWNDLYINGVRKTYTGPTHDMIVDYEPSVLYRIGVATGEYTSGTVNVRLSK